MTAKPANSFTGRVAVVSGAASGIGRAVAEALGAQGAKLVLGDIQNRELDKLAGELRAKGFDVLARTLDVTKEQDWADLFGAGASKFGPISMLVASAGIAVANPIADQSLAQWREVMAVNLDGTFLGVREAARAMRGGGAITVISSSTAAKPAPMAAAYGASKAAVVHLAKSAALELAGRKPPIRVNAVLPGGVITPMWKKIPEWGTWLNAHGGDEEAVFDTLAAETPLKRFASAAEVAHTILYTLSDEAAHLTGAALVLDGGYAT